MEDWLDLRRDVEMEWRNEMVREEWEDRRRKGE